MYAQQLILKSPTAKIRSLGADKYSQIRMFGGSACIAAVASSAATIGFTVYVFVIESRNRLPEFFAQWRNTSFSQEFYLCEAFPSLIDDAQSLYGFPACSVSVSRSHDKEASS